MAKPTRDTFIGLEHTNVGRTSEDLEMTGGNQAILATFDDKITSIIEEILSPIVVARRESNRAEAIQVIVIVNEQSLDLW